MVQELKVRPLVGEALLIDGLDFVAGWRSGVVPKPVVVCEIASQLAEDVVMGLLTGMANEDAVKVLLGDLYFQGLKM